MQTIILDPCRFTCLGLMHSLVENGVSIREIAYVSILEELKLGCKKQIPRVVFINEACFAENSLTRGELRTLIAERPKDLFIIFMSKTNNHFEEYVFVRKNVIITSKAIKTQTLGSLLGSHIAEYNQLRTGESPLDNSPLVLSRSESNMLKMWMSGEDTHQISHKMHIKVKTVSSYKGNIKRKIKTQNKHIIYHVVRLSDSLTEGIYVS